MKIFFQKYKNHFLNIISSYASLFPLFKNRAQIISFRILLLIISLVLIMSAILFYINKKIVIKTIELSSPVEIIFDKNFNAEQIQDAIEKIKKVPDVTNVTFFTSDTLRLEIVPSDTIFLEAELSGISPFQNIATASIRHSIGNEERRINNIAEIEKIDGVNFVSYNQLRFARLDYLVNLTDKIILIIMIFSIIFFLIVSTISSFYLFRFNIFETEYIKTIMTIIPTFSLKNIYFYEGIFCGIISFIVSSVILCVLWIISMLLLSFRFVFFPIWQIIFFIIFFPLLLSGINLIIFSKLRKNFK